MSRTCWRGILVALLLAAACGDDDGPAARCRFLVGAACRELDSCDVLSNVEQCRRDQARVLGCDEATDVSDGYPECVEDIQTRDCAAWTTSLNQDFALPESCRSVFVK